MTSLKRHNNNKKTKAMPNKIKKRAKTIIIKFQSEKM